MLRYFILCITFLHSAYEIADYAMYTFNVGQGNCQLAKYRVQNTDDDTHKIIGFLVDCGKKEVNYDEKFAYIPNNYVKIIESGKSSPMDRSNPTDVKVDYSSIPPTDIQGATNSKYSEVVFAESAQHDNRKNDRQSKLFEHVKSCLSDIHLLIIFLSHLDEDYINKVKDVVIQLNGKPSIISFLCGNFLENSTGDVQKVKNHLNSISCMFYPYYWSGENEDYSDFFSGNLMNLLNKAKQYRRSSCTGDTDKQAQYYKQMRTYYNNVLESFKNQLEAMQDHVNIFSMNTKKASTGTENAKANPCSTIVQFTFPNKTPNHYTDFICTGDAEISTVNEMQQGHNKEHYENISQNNNGLDKTIFNSKSNLLKKKHLYLGLLMDNSKESHKCLRLMMPTSDVILTIPHHGSSTKNQNTALTSLMNIFKPHALIVSAGSGSKYGHPDTGFVNLFSTNDTEITSFKKRHKEFLTRNKQIFKFGLVDFSGKSQFNNITFGHQYIWSTYYNGSIKFHNGDYLVDGPSILKNSTGKLITQSEIRDYVKFLHSADINDKKGHYTINLIKEIQANATQSYDVLQKYPILQNCYTIKTDALKYNLHMNADLTRGIILQNSTWYILIKKDLVKGEFTNVFRITKSVINRYLEKTKNQYESINGNCSYLLTRACSTILSDGKPKVDFDIVHSIPEFAYLSSNKNVNSDLYIAKTRDLSYGFKWINDKWYLIELTESTALDAIDTSIEAMAARGNTVQASAQVTTATESLSSTLSAPNDAGQSTSSITHQGVQHLSGNTSPRGPFPAAPLLSPPPIRR